MPGFPNSDLSKYWALLSEGDEAVLGILTGKDGAFSVRILRITENPDLVDLVDSYLTVGRNATIKGQGYSPLEADSLTSGTDPTHTVDYNQGNVHKITLGGYSGTAAITIGGASTNQASGATYRILLTASGGTRAYSISGVTAWVTPEPDGSLAQDTSVIIYLEVYGSTVLGFATADIPTPV